MTHPTATIRAVSLNQIAEELRHALGDRAPARITLHRHSEAGLLRHMAIRPKGKAKRLLYNADAVIAHYTSNAGRPTRGKPQRTSQAPQEAQWHQSTSTEATNHLVAQSNHRPSEPMSPQTSPVGTAFRIRPNETPTAPTAPVTPAARTAPPVDAQAAAEAITKLATPLIEAQVAKALAPLQNLLQRIDQNLGTLEATRTSLMLKYDATAALTQQKLETAQAEVLRLRGADNLDLQVARIQKDVSRLQEAIQSFLTRSE